MRMTLRTTPNDPECSAQLTVEHDGLPIGADLVVALALPTAATGDPRLRAAALADDRALLALEYAAADLGGTLAGKNLPGRGAALTVRIPMVPSEEPLADIE